MDQALQKSIGVIQGRQAAEITASVEAAIRDGELSPGDLLPTVRALASALRVSPTTVSSAYRELRGRGLLVTEGRRGTRVSPAPPVMAPAAAPLPAGTLDLASGNPDPALLPRLGPFLAKLDPEPHLYAEQVHLPELIELAEARLRADGVPYPAVSVVSGALDGIERVLLAHLRPGDRVAVEDPGFGGVYHLLRAMGHPVEPIALDDDGALPDALERAIARGARAVVLTPRAQNPTGAAFTPDRVTELQTILDRHPEILIIEDDHNAEASGAAAATLCRDSTPRFAVVRSVSKTLGPDLRLAILAGDRETIARVEGRQLLGSRWVSHLLQHLVVRLWKDRGVTRLVARAEKTYTARREALLAALADRGLPAHGRSGMNVWVPVVEETTAVQQLLARGYAVRAGESYRLLSSPALRLTTAALPTEEAPRVAEALAAAGAAPLTHGT
ncbi:MAG: aminotransferase class I/II-fold pyridoxal phosphate-dependent enzyme [Deltaproteobacteria bacterium]|nr:aminotransferase class I/II-fold pyridoxal phosphate-dependent enzyme [Deltaproteobacteria bacterium]MBW2394033.1 aminotransferase class I/II-fold pyridoxal phosphate-dependent enzyme [Deltaproteobacteria bacterium]